VTVAVDTVLDVRPAAPSTPEEAGLSHDLVVQLALKTLHFGGTLTGLELATRLGLSYAVIDGPLEQLVQQRHVEINGGAMIGRASYRYRISDAGRERAGLFLETNQYVGIAPVPLQQYRRYMLAFRDAHPGRVLRADVRKAFSHLVLNDRVLDQLGPAINSGHSMFVYGPPGNGKSVISQAISRLLTGTIAIPHALEVEGNIIRLFDPVNHEPIELDDTVDGLSALDAQGRRDARWVVCKRPMVMVGGELTLDGLELSYATGAGFYSAPVQAKANGGVLVIDDFGRQSASPRDLLNRWIVPLGSGVDFLTLQSGQKFDIPFTALVAFATNIKPADLVDEAFLRRIHYKIFIESPTVPEFMEIFRRVCEVRGVPFDPHPVEHMLQTYYRPKQIPLRGCQPGDILDQVISLADYCDVPRVLTPELLEAACASYFVDDREVPVSYA
jgi:predicted ATPase with chaperone activity